MKFILFLLPVSILLSCSQKETIAGPEKSYFIYPLQVGNSWTYQGIYTVDSNEVTIENDTFNFQYKVTKRIQVFGDTVFVLRTFSLDDSSGWNSLLGLDANGNICLVDTLGNKIRRTMMFPKNPSIGMQWVDSNMVICAEECDTFPSSRSVITGRNTISTLSGLYHDCWILESYSLTNHNGSNIYNYHSGTGLVSFIETNVDTVLKVKRSRYASLISFSNYEVY